MSDAYKKVLLPSENWFGEVMMYNLDVVIAVGYRINSYEATQFRICLLWKNSSDCSKLILVAILGSHVQSEENDE